MNYKVAILHQGFIPKYRVKFYELLAFETGNRYVVFHGSASSNEGYRAFDGTPLFSNVKVKNYEFSFLGMRVTYQPVLLKILLGSFDAIILGHELKYLSNLIIFCLCKTIGKPIIWWGHGFHIDRRLFSRSGYITPVVARLKSILARGADMYLVYTEGGCQKLLQSGVRKEKIRPVRNTIDMAEHVGLYEKYRNANVEEIRNDYNLRSASVVLLYIGRIIQEKRVEELLSLVKQINAQNMCLTYVEAVIIGAGPELNRIKRIGEEIEGVHILGQIDDEDVIARYMRISSAFVIPGKTGLAVNYAFAHGVPVLTRQHNYHAPEVEYIVSGENGLIVDGDFDSFVRAIAGYVNSPAAQNTLAKGALKTRDSLSLSFMVKAFDEATCEAIRRKHGLSGGDASTGTD